MILHDKLYSMDKTILTPSGVWLRVARDNAGVSSRCTEQIGNAEDIEVHHRWIYPNILIFHEIRNTNIIQDTIQTYTTKRNIATGTEISKKLRNNGTVSGPSYRECFGTSYLISIARRTGIYYSQRGSCTSCK